MGKRSTKIMVEQDMCAVCRRIAVIWGGFGSKVAFGYVMVMVFVWVCCLVFDRFFYVEICIESNFFT